MEKFFKLKESGTNVSRDYCGATTFLLWLTYLCKPQMLSQQAYLMVAFSSHNYCDIIDTLVMGLLQMYPTHRHLVWD